MEKTEMTSPGSRWMPFAAMLAALALLGGCVGQIGGAEAGLTTGSGTGGAGSSSGVALGSGGLIGTTGTGGSIGSTGTGGSTSTTTVASDLPCDVATLLANKCAACHGPHPAGGAPMGLTNYAQMTAPAISDPTKTMAVVAIARMVNATAPMPPVAYPQATSAEISALQNWISAGYPTTGCSSVTTTNGPDAGMPPPDPFSVAPTCTSGKSWTGGTNGSGSMQPGVACINCHNSSGGEAPRFTIAGTLYPTAHEPNQCNGVNGSTAGAKVVITDAKQNVITLTPNSAGNFYYTGAIATPFHAKVADMNGERDMVAGQSSGDCNACHTQNGTMLAPGRIILP
jgi:mono/diheme cytochrome c family protein